MEWPSHKKKKDQLLASTGCVADFFVPRNAADREVKWTEKKMGEKYWFSLLSWKWVCNEITTQMSAIDYYYYIWVGRLLPPLQQPPLLLHLHTLSAILHGNLPWRPQHHCTGRTDYVIRKNYIHWLASATRKNKPTKSRKKRKMNQFGTWEPYDWKRIHTNKCCDCWKILQKHTPPIRAFKVNSVLLGRRSLFAKSFIHAYDRSK